MKRMFSVIGMALLIFGSVGCGYTTLRRPEQAAPEKNPMTVNDVIALSNDGVGDSVIIAQIQATQSAFALSNQEIIDLKNSGVSENVIAAMIKTAERSRKGGRSHAYVPYPYYGYPLSYWGLSWGWGGYYSEHRHYLGGHHYGGHGISRSHVGRIGGPRSFGRR
ncbi:hypothetical protein HUU40_09815 [candidate division KSB1 bacterium]|nr:hypothetical protein [candidate division KSB1 bacterium]